MGPLMRPLLIYGLAKLRLHGSPASTQRKKPGNKKAGLHMH